MAKKKQPVTTEEEVVSENEEVVTPEVPVETTETPVASEEAKPAEESKEESKVDKMLSHPEPLVIETPEDRDFGEVIEEARQEIQKKYSKNRRVSNIVTFISVAFIVVAFILIVQSTAWMQYVGYGVGGATLIFMIVWYFVNRNKLPRAVKEYVKVVTKTLNGHAFRNTEFSELKSDPNDKLQLTDILADGVYKDATSIASRNVITGEYAKRSFSIGDVAMRTGSGKKTENIFFGKYITYVNDLHFEGRYVIVSKGAQELDLPNALEDLVVLEEDEKFLIYGPEGRTYKKELGTKVVPLLKQIKVDDPLLNLVVCLWAGHSAAYLSYTDAIISLPFEKEYNKEPFDSYVSEQNQIMNALKTLIK